MRILIIAFVVMIGVTILSGRVGREADVKLAIHQADAQAKLNEEQRTILVRLEEKKDAQVSEFIRDWVSAYPVASTEGLQELRLIEQKINNDISIAAQFTLAAHQAKADKLNEAVASPLGVLGVQFEARPGI